MTCKTWVANICQQLWNGLKALEAILQKTAIVSLKEERLFVLPSTSTDVYCWRILGIAKIARRWLLQASLESSLVGKSDLQRPSPFRMKFLHWGAVKGINWCIACIASAFDAISAEQVSSLCSGMRFYTYALDCYPKRATWLKIADAFHTALVWIAQWDLCLRMQGKRRVSRLAKFTRTSCLLPLQKLAEETLAVYSKDVSLLQETLGLQRILEVLSRIMQITEDKSSSWHRITTR